MDAFPGIAAQVAATLFVALAVSFAVLPVRRYLDYAFGIIGLLAATLTLLVSLHAASDPSFPYRAPNVVLGLMLAGLTGFCMITFMLHLVELNRVRFEREKAERQRVEDETRVAAAAAAKTLKARWRALHAKLGM